eukprot:TRINITY_DN10480_c0_g1_i1.p1 TRINITY_DN10480_c0_g1~~TRINITY_DN10480_c0_g1_i1.p1  ORF type:complete len:475 (+),score=86.64 TRINITY_DN10480_c0_g1_i1:16-1440(+)
MARPSDVFGDMVADDAAQLGEEARRRALAGSTTKMTFLGGNPLDIDFGSGMKGKGRRKAAINSSLKAKPPPQGGAKTAPPKPAPQQQQQPQPQQQEQQDQRFFHSERSASPKTERGRSQRKKESAPTPQHPLQTPKPSSPVRPVAPVVLEKRSPESTDSHTDSEGVTAWDSIPDSKPKASPPPPAPQSVSELLAKKKADLASLKKRLEQMQDADPPAPPVQSVARKQQEKPPRKPPVPKFKKKTSVTSSQGTQSKNKIQKNVMPCMKTKREMKIRTESHSRVSSSTGQGFSTANVAAPAPPLLDFDEIPVGAAGRYRKNTISSLKEYPTPTIEPPHSPPHDTLSGSPSSFEDSDTSSVIPVIPISSPVKAPIHPKPNAAVAMNPGHGLQRPANVEPSQDSYRTYWPTPRHDVLPWDDPHSCQCCGKALNVCGTCRDRQIHPVAVTANYRPHWGGYGDSGFQQHFLNDNQYCYYT